MEKRDFDGERDELNNRVKDYTKQIQTLAQKTKKLKIARRAVTYKLSALTREEQKARKAELLEPKKAGGELSLEEYARQHHLTLVDAVAKDDPFFDLMKKQYGVAFYSAYSFYDCLSWLDESCRAAPLERKYFIDQKAVAGVVQKFSRLHPEKLNELEKNRLPKKGETKTEWKKRFFAFLLAEPYSKIISPQRKLELEIRLKVDAVERPR